MLVLGIESTCDETGVAIVEDGNNIRSNAIASQVELHKEHGGVIPELASRRHLVACVPLLEQALLDANVSLDEIDLIAVARGPGLIGALLVGLNFAKGLALSTNKPLVGVNHIEAHLYATLMDKQVELPALGVIISGGHTALVKMEKLGSYELIGQTHDDAIGEAFDKVARLLELPYPGGPEIEKLARTGDPTRFALKGGRIKNQPFDFSFSGIKTSVLYKVKGQNAQKDSPLLIGEEEKKDVAASFQQAVFADLVEKIDLATKSYDCNSVVFGGGVSCNLALRELCHLDCPIYWPAPGLCLDNGAMIAALGYHLYHKKKRSDPLTIEPLVRIPWR